MARFTYLLQPIDGVEDNPEHTFKIRALVHKIFTEEGIVKKSVIFKELNDLDLKNLRKIIKSMNDVAKNGMSSHYLKKDRRRMVYEITTFTGIRVLCFLDKEGKILICDRLYKKSRGGEVRAQTNVFKACFNAKKRYYKEMYHEQINQMKEA